MSMSNSGPGTNKQDILLLGATGYTGKLILKYLAAGATASQFTLALGGRSKERMESAAREAGLETMPVIEFDVLNEAQVRDVIQHFRIVITAVGPFWSYGRVLVRACAGLGVHYVDTTGETHFIRDCIEQLDYGATKTGAVIIPSAGFDSVPSDLSAYLGVHALKQFFGDDVQVGSSTSAFNFKASTISGGTTATLIQMITGVIPRWAVSRSSGQYSLSPFAGPRVNDRTLTRRLPLTSIVGGLFPMARVNERYVRRTWGMFALHSKTNSSTNIPEGEKHYGDNFAYSEFMQTGTWIGGLLASLSFVLGMSLLLVPPLRWFAQRFILHKPGDGPPESDLKTGWLKVTNVTCSVPEEGKRVKAVKTVIKARGEPGYFLAAVIASETALALLPGSFHRLTELGKQGGVLTAMSALGLQLPERLKATNLFDFRSSVLADGEHDGQESRKTI